MVYLDNASTTQVTSEVISAMLPYFASNYGNPGNTHAMGAMAYDAISLARKRVADVIHADPSEIIFTSGGSEANSLAIKGVLNYLRGIGKTHIVSTRVEHSSVPLAIFSAFGFDATFVGVDKKTGRVSPQDVIDAMRPDTGLVSVMHTNNETGAVNPVEEIGALIHERGALFHSDCVQAFCHTDIDVSTGFADFISVSGHKIHAPKGIGALYVRDKTLLRPLICGSESQEDGLRGGTQNVPYIVGFGVAAEYNGNAVNMQNYRNHVAECNRRFISGLTENGIKFHTHAADPTSNIVNISFDGVDGETLGAFLSLNEIFVSSGSACEERQRTPSHVLKNLGLSDDEARSSLRFSFSDMTVLSDIDKAVETTVRLVNGLRTVKANEV